MSLKTRIIFLMFFLVVILTGGISITLFFTQAELIRKKLESDREKIFKDFTNTVKEALIVKDEIMVLNINKALVKTYYPAVDYSIYISPYEKAFPAVKEGYQTDELVTTRGIKPEKYSVEIFDFKGNRIYEYATPVFLPDSNEYVGSIRVGFSQEYLEEEVAKAVKHLGGKILEISIAGLFIGLFLGFVFSINLISPIKKLTKSAIELGNGNLDTQVNISRKDELGKLAKTFNEMAKKLKQLDELKDAFISSVSHELRSPLAAIDGYTDLLIDSFKEGKVQLEKTFKALTIIKDSTVRLTNFINDILDIAKIKAGRFEIKKESVDLYNICMDVVTLFTSIAEKKKIKLVNESTPGIFIVNADMEKIRQVITNLVSNALKFTPENGKITVGAVDSGNFVEVYVKDTGPGIPKEHLDKIFDKFYQVTDGPEKKPKGTGLGLAIASEIVKLHNGRIWAESELGKGSTFKFTLPKQ